jgi:hypothetical protein
MSARTQVANKRPVGYRRLFNIDKKESTTLKLFAIVTAIVFVSICQFSESSSPQKAQPIVVPTAYKATIEGLVRDVACPMQNHKSTSTNFNMDCALACAKRGSPLIILTKDGDIYFPISDQMPDPSQREKMMPFVGKQVRAIGTVYRRNGTRTIVISDIKEMKGIKVRNESE